MFILESKHNNIVFQKDKTIREFARTIDCLEEDKRRIIEELEELKQVKTYSQSKQKNYLIVIGDWKLDVKGHYFELDDNALTVYRYGATGTDTVFHCNKFDYIIICE